MSDLEKLENKRQSLINDYEATTHMMAWYVELVKQYHEICLEIDNEIVEIDQAITTIKEIKKSPS